LGKSLPALSVGKLISSWPLLRQLDGDRHRLGRSARSPEHATLRPRTDKAERVVKSICPFCAVGCGQLVYVRDGKVDQIEGDPDSPISRGRLCPKGSATKSLVTSPLREYRVKYRRPYGRDWEELSLDDAMDMIADRIIATRAESWEEEQDGKRTRRCMGIAHLGGATLDIEENYLLKKLYTSLGIVQVENQARI
jgi:formate dehydrogenase major subunit